MERRVIDSVFPIASRPFGVAINSVGTVLVGKQDANNVVKGSVANFTFPTTIAAGADPGTLAMAPNGATAVISNFNDASVGFIDIATNLQTDTVSVGSSPYQVKYSPDGTKVYVGTAASGLRVRSATTHDSLKTLAAGNQLNGLALSASGCKLYASSISGNTVAEISVTNDTILRFITAGSQPQEVAVSQDSSELWVADEIAGVQVYSLPSGNLSTTIPGTAGAWGLAMTPDGQQLYSTRTSVGKIMIIDRASRTVLDSLSAGIPRRIAFDRLGAHAVIADELEGAILIK